MRAFLFILILSIFASGFTSAASAFGHVGAQGKQTHIIDCCPDPLSAEDMPQKYDQNDASKNLVDMGCHHSCTMQIDFAVPKQENFTKRTAQHEYYPAYHTKIGVLLSLFRPPQKTA